MKWSALAILATGCMALGPKHPPTAREQIVAGLAGAAIAGAALTGAAFAHDEPIATQAGVTTMTAAIPMGAIFLGDEDDEQASTPGGIYSALGSGLVSSLGASLTFVAPLLGAYMSGGETQHSERAMYGTVGGVAVGTVAGALIGKHLPRWAGVVVGAIVVGSTATLGYQLGGGGPP